LVPRWSANGEAMRGFGTQMPEWPLYPYIAARIVAEIWFEKSCGIPR